MKANTHPDLPLSRPYNRWWTGIRNSYLATKIDEIIKSRKLTQQQAAIILGMPQPKLSTMLRGQFRGISETKMLDCLVRLGRKVQIVIGSPQRAASQGHISVRFT